VAGIKGFFKKGAITEAITSFVSKHSPPESPGTYQQVRDSVKRLREMEAIENNLPSKAPTPPDKHPIDSSGSQLVLRRFWTSAFTYSIWTLYNFLRATNAKIPHLTVAHARVIAEAITSRSSFAFYAAPALELPLFLGAYVLLFPYLGWWGAIGFGSAAISLMHDGGPYTDRQLKWALIRTIGAGLIAVISFWPLHSLFPDSFTQVTYSNLFAPYLRIDWVWAILANYGSHVIWNRLIPPPGRLVLDPSEHKQVHPALEADLLVVSIGYSIENSFSSRDWRRTLELVIPWTIGEAQSLPLKMNRKLANLKSVALQGFAKAVVMADASTIHWLEEVLAKHHEWVSLHLNSLNVAITQESDLQYRKARIHHQGILMLPRIFRDKENPERFLIRRAA
jgi:hypothetical protein